MARLDRLTLDALEIEDATSFKHVSLFGELSGVLRDAKVEFLVARPPGISWDRALLLNLAFWDEATSGGDVLVEKSIPADVVMHVAWHHLASSRLDGTFESEILGEAIASAFDLYLVGRLLGHAPDSSFLETQIPAMADAAASEGVDEDAFEETLREVAADPDRAFEDLRALLFETTIELAAVTTADDALGILSAKEGRRFSELLHHYELATWILRGKARVGSGSKKSGESARTVDEALRRAPSSVEWLRAQWVESARVASRGEKP